MHLSRRSLPRYAAAVVGVVGCVALALGSTSVAGASGASAAAHTSAAAAHTSAMAQDGSSASSALYRSAESFRGRAPVIPVTVTTGSGFSLPERVRAGFVTFKVGTPASESDGHAFQGFRTKNGATLADVMHDFNLGLLGTPPQMAAGARGLLHDATLVVGVFTTPFAPISATVALEPGTYYFFDYTDLFNGVAPRVHTLRAVGDPEWHGLPRFGKVIVTTMINGKPRFIAPTDQEARDTFLVVNSADEIHEAVWRQTKPGITDAYVTKFYNSIIAGHPLASPWVDVQHGMGAISPGRFAVVHIDFPKGRYALICYVPDDTTGLPHGWIGMHKVVKMD